VKEFDQGADTEGDMRKSSRLGLFATLLVGIFLVVPRFASADVTKSTQNANFPRPIALAPNVAFWKQIYTDHGVGDFVLHDRDNLGVVYEIVRVPEKNNQARAADLAKPEIERVRARYKDLLHRMAAGATPDELGAEGRVVAELWACPCSADTLRRAAESIRVQQGLREKVDEGLRRAQSLLPRMVNILQRHDVPVELAALPLVESTFNPAAYSKAGAVGLWQFIRSTGKRYLTITRKRDDRRDPIRATEAAAHLLKNNYNALGSWPLAIVAYNHGHAGIQAASAAVGSTAIEDIVTRYNGPRFGFASKNFYAEFLAALDVVHPYLAGHAKSLEAKGRRRSPQQASISTQRPPAPTLAPQAPPVVSAPVEPDPVVEASVPVAAPEPAAEPSLPSVDPSLGEQPVTVEEAAVLLDPLEVTAPSSPESDMTPPLANGDASPHETTLHDTTPPEVPETDSPEAVSP
jgi:Transglycosylase SLT domain